MQRFCVNRALKNCSYFLLSSNGTCALKWVKHASIGNCIDNHGIKISNKSLVFLKVKELSGELSKRISAEEVEAAVNNAVHQMEKELENALKRAESLRVELETNEKLLKQLQREWDEERTSLRGALANVKGQLTELQMEQASDKAKLKEALERVIIFSIVIL